MQITKLLYIKNLPANRDYFLLPSINPDFSIILFLLTFTIFVWSESVIFLSNCQNQLNKISKWQVGAGIRTN